MGYLIKTSDKLIGDNDYPIGSNLLELKNTGTVSLNEVNSKLSSILENYDILKFDTIAKYLSYNNNTYELALKIVEDNNDFYYESSLWTDSNLLNEYNYDKLVNSKYECYVNKPFSNMILILNDKEMHIHLSTPVNSLKELFTNGGNTLSVDEFILYDSVSPFGFNRILEIYNIQFSINYYASDGWSTIQYRMALLLNNVKAYNLNGDLGASAEGIGLYGKSTSAAGGLNMTQRVSSGCLGWCVIKEFANALLYIS